MAIIMFTHQLTAGGEPGAPGPNAARRVALGSRLEPANATTLSPYLGKTALGRGRRKRAARWPSAQVCVPD